jgi:serine/threonine protein kinase
MISDRGVLLLGDMGSAHSAHSLVLLPTEEITTEYARSPERLLGEIRSATAIDVWAVGVVAACFALGHCPWMMGLDDRSPVHRVFEPLYALLGPVTATCWPGIESLPNWFQLQADSLASRVQPVHDEHHSTFEERLMALKPFAGGPDSVAVRTASAAMRWCPAIRPTADELALTTQTLRELSGREPAPPTPPPKRQRQAAQSWSSVTHVGN